MDYPWKYVSKTGFVVCRPVWKLFSFPYRKSCRNVSTTCMVLHFRRIPLPKACRNTQRLDKPWTMSWFATTTIPWPRSAALSHVNWGASLPDFPQRYLTQSMPFQVPRQITKKIQLFITMHKSYLTQWNYNCWGKNCHFSIHMFFKQCYNINLLYKWVRFNGLVESFETQLTWHITIF